MIRLKGVCKYFTTTAGTIRAVDDIDLDVKEGEIFGIIGYSGAGKKHLDPNHQFAGAPECWGGEGWGARVHIAIRERP